MARFSRRRAVLSLEPEQAGDVRTGDAAGGNIYHQGMDPAQALAFVRDYIWEADQHRERQLERLADALELHEISERQRREADAQQRARRQLLYDVWMVALTLLVLALLWRVLALPDPVALVRLWLGAGLALALIRLQP